MIAHAGSTAHRPSSLGRRLLLLVVLGAVVPLGTVGVWATWTAARSGETLLRVQLDSALASGVREIRRRWESRQSDLLMLAENEPVRLAMTDSLSGTRATTPPPFVTQAFATMSGIERAVLRDRTGRLRWTLEVPRALGPAPEAGAPPGFAAQRTVPVTLPVTDIISGDTIGTLDAQLRASALLPSLSLQQSTHGPMTAIFFGVHGSLLPPAAEGDMFRPVGRDHAGNRWISVRSHLDTPDMDVVVAAMLDPYVQPFQRSARIEALALFGAALLLVAIVILLMRRVTGELDLVVVAAEAVSAGDLDRQLPVLASDEVGRIAAAFNTMTESLRRTMRELSRKEALAAVGEFASELSHEIRNPLTSIRLDLQRIEEVAGDAAAVRGITPRLLQQIGRLDRAVTGALRVARGARPQVAAVDIVDVVRAAMRVAAPEFVARGAHLVMDEAPAGIAPLPGDAEALEQVFVNLLINAAHALPAGGTARVCVEQADGMVVVTVSDGGSGMSNDQLAHLKEPFRSSKRDGTGLGLKIARRLVEAHRGRLEIESVLGTGTTVRVRLPVVGEVASPDDPTSPLA